MNEIGGERKGIRQAESARDTDVQSSPLISDRDRKISSIEDLTPKALATLLRLDTITLIGVEDVIYKLTGCISI